jgi:hypothetical protein
MTNTRLLFLVKFVHTLAFFVLAPSTLYIFYCGLSGQRDVLLWWALGLVTLESVVFLGNGRRCPLTKLAQQLGDPTGNDLIADLFLPEWLAQRIMPIFGSMFVIGLLLLMFNGR